MATRPLLTQRSLAALESRRQRMLDIPRMTGPRNRSAVVSHRRWPAIRRYTCDPDPCPWTPVDNAHATGDCYERTGSGQLESGEACNPRCLDGYSASVLGGNGEGLLLCSLGVLDGSFICEPNGCSLPLVPNAHADGPCLGGAAFAFAHGTECTPQCHAGYTPSSSTNLVCNLGDVSGSFTCLPGLPTVSIATA